MKKIFKYLSLFLLVFTLAFTTSCNSDNPDDTEVGDKGDNGNEGGNGDGGNDDGGSTSTAIDYTVECKSINGKPLADFVVSFKLDGTTVKQGLTDIYGQFTANLDKNIYTVNVSAADGYILNSYTNKTDLLGTKIEVTATPELILENAPEEHSYSEGDVMYDFTLTDTSGDEYNLSSLLQEKRAVILNFWYSDCYYCCQEFPYMQEAYASSYEAEDGSTRLYSDDIAILAINYGYDDEAGIISFKTQYGLTFPMMLDYMIDSTPALTSMFGVTAFPTTVVIDSFGTIAEIEDGAITSTGKWTDCFDTYIDSEYYPVWTGTVDGSEEDERVKPNVTMPESSVLESVVCGTNQDGSKFATTFKPEDNETDAEWSWPWIVSEDGDSMIPSNKYIDNSFAIVYLDVTLKAGEAFAFDYYCSTEEYDILYVIADNTIATTISGISPDWEKSYAFVALENGTYEISLTYLKDSSTSTGDDQIYIKNMRICDATSIDKETYIFRECATGQLSIMTESYAKYASVYYNEEDGFYHVDSLTGPLLLADLISGTKWSNSSMYEMSLEEPFVVNDVDYNDLIEEYASYANNSKIGYTPVTLELANALKAITKAYGSETASQNENQWLEVCVYYSAYGTNGVELENPIIGLAPFTAIEFDDNNQASAYFDRVILPRGYVFGFTPTVSGVYKFYSTGDLETNCWLFDSDMTQIGSADEELRIFAKNYTEGNEDPNFVSYFYYEAGNTYYIRAGFYDIYEFSTITIGYEYVAESLDLLTAVSSGFFTSSDDEMSDIITGGLSVELGDDGYYHVVSGAKNDDLVYCDVTYVTSLFSLSILEMLEIGEADDVLPINKAFDFRYDELGNSLVNEDGYLLDEDGNIYYDENGDPITVPDCTATVRHYITENMITDTDSELYGMVKVDENFANILQLLMDKYTFAGIENSWTKLCYYFKYLGASE